MSTKIKILYIDDEEHNLTAFVRLFRRLYNVKTASSAKEGSEILKEEFFHVILVDQRMPGTTGSEFFKEIADLYPNTLRVLVTAYSDLEAVISAVNEGKIYKYVSKPYKKEVMMEVISNAYQVYQYRSSNRNDFSKYKEAFSSSKEAIFLISEDAKVIDINDACLNLLELSRDHLISQNAEINIFKKISIDFERCLTSKEYKEFDNAEATFQMKNGDKHDCLVSLTKISTDEGALVSYQGTIKNISKYKESRRVALRALLDQKVREDETLVNLLHEKSAQNLTGIHFVLNKLQRTAESQNDKETLNQVNDLLIDTISELREVCFQMIPKSLDYGINGALEDLASKIETVYNTQCNIEIEDNLPDTSREFRIMLFRAIQSSLKGVKKENSSLLIEINSKEHSIFTEITGQKTEDSKEITGQIMTEIDCYGGTFNQSNPSSNQVSYQIELPVY